MSAITLARKPLSETSVAANALRWGTGGINIDGSRIGGSVPQVTQGVSATPTSYPIASNTQQSQPSPLGRWPANLILQHKPGCQVIGHRTLPGYQINRWDGGVRFAVGGSESQDYEQVEMGESEDVPVWACAEGCPVADLDEQSGYSASKKTMRGVGWNDSPIYSDSGDPDFDTERGFDDEGGASRFFKQTQTEDDVSAPPQDLISYLTTLISPPDQTVTHLGDVDTIAWDVVALMGDASVCGLIVRGTPTEEQAAELMRILMPGAHLLLIAPEEQPTGHTGACRIEDVGFEIRDAILWAREAGGLHYVPKASRSEREAGCGFLEGKTGAEATDREEDSDGLNSPRAGAGRSAESVKNWHPCLHPEALVMTDRGYRPIEEIQVGDKVYTADGTFHPVEVISRHPYTSENLYEIAVRGTNYTVSASDNHPFLIWRPTRKGNAITGGEVLWLQADELRKGDYTMTPELRGFGLLDLDDLPAPHAPLFFLMGLWAAEGVVHKAGHGNNVYPSWTLHEDESDLVARIQNFFGDRQVNVGVYPKDGAKAVQVVAFDPHIGAMFVRWVGTGAGTKSLNPDVFGLPKPCRKALLEGYLAGDGGTVRNYQQAKTVSLDLASQFRLLGASLGYKANLYWYPAEDGGIGEREFKSTLPTYQLRFYSQDMNQTIRKPAMPTTVDYEGTTFRLAYIQAVDEVPYDGDVVNLTVQGSPTFQTAVGMSHNTVKPIGVMKRLLMDLPTDEGPIIDPFNGSGTTGLACLRTGHDYIGIEREEEYGIIATSRAMHWDTELRAGATIESDFEVPINTGEGQKGEVAAPGDFFGFGD